MVAHVARPALSPRHPVLVTTRLCAGLPSLRNPGVRAVLLRAIAAGSRRSGFRLVEFSIQTNHLHAIAEGEDERALSLGVQGLFIRIARALNRHWGRKGKVFADRFHAGVLRETWEVRNALVYTLQNARKHGVVIVESGRSGGAGVLRLASDPYSSGLWFDGWNPDRFVMPPTHDGLDPTLHRHGPRPTPLAETWLLKTGWRQHGLIDLCEGPVERRVGAAPHIHRSG